MCLNKIKAKPGISPKAANTAAAATCVWVQRWFLVAAVMFEHDLLPPVPLQ
jgi:hypothetical protein